MNTTQKIITFFKVLFSGIYTLFNKIHSILPQKSRKYVYWITLFIFIVFCSFLTFKKQLNLFMMDVIIKYNEYEQNQNQKIFNNEEKILQNEIKEFTQQISKKVLAKKELCVQTEYTTILKDLRQKEVLLTNELAEKIKNNITFNVCSFESIREKEVKYLLNLLSNQLQTKIEVELNKELDKIQEEEKTKKETMLVLDDNYTIDENEYYAFLQKQPWGEDEEYINKFKNKENLKAIFCSYWHGLTNNKNIDKNTLDPWYVINRSDYSTWDWETLTQYVDTYAYDYIKDSFHKSNSLSERQLVEMMNPSSCEYLRKHLEPKGIDVYEIGKNPLMSLGDKILLINKISKEKWYDQTNAIVYELHSNSVQNPDKSGLEVFYSHYEQHNNWYQGRDLALTVLNSIEKTHKKYSTANSVYVVKPDGKSKHAYLGITSVTKPLGMLIEYWFKKNLNDVTIILEHHKEIGESIAKGIIDFIE